MPDLDHIQRWMQSVIMNVGGVEAGMASDEARALIDVAPEQADKVITRSKALSAVERLDIYHNAYHARLLECLREEFPATLHAVGEETFDQFAISYLQKYPSTSYTLNRLGSSFAQYLRETRPEPERDDGKPDWPDFLIDLVTLEQVYSEVFDGPGVEGKELLTAERLQEISPVRWPAARLIPVPCLRLARFRFPIHRYITAVRKEKGPATPRPSEVRLAITRRDFVVRRYELTKAQFTLLSALIEGKTVADAIAETVETNRRTPKLGESLHLWFRNWTAEGFFADCRL